MYDTKGNKHHIQIFDNILDFGQPHQYFQITEKVLYIQVQQLFF